MWIKQFVKWFIAAVVAQALLFGITFTFPIKPLQPIGEVFFLIFYIGPVALFVSEGSAVKKDVSDFILFVVPMLIWSALIAIGICVVTALRKRNDPE